MTPFMMALMLALQLGSGYPIRIFGYVHGDMTPTDLDKVTFGSLPNWPGEENYVKFLMEKTKFPVCGEVK